MKRALVLTLTVLAGCQDTIKLDEVSVAYACSVDGGEEQCSGGWRCGLDGKCFDPAVARPVSTACTDDLQCADDSRCGEAVEGRRACLLRGVGSAAACVSGAGCEGGWRCGLDGVCFDDQVTDGARSRTCSDDAQCPATFRCGQDVGGVRRCQSATEGAASPCVDDDGCVGGWRCNTIDLACVLVTDTVQSPVLGDVTSTQLSPKRAGEPTPLRFAMSREAPVQTGGFGFQPSTRPAVSMARLFDGGVSYVLNLATTQGRADGGAATAIAEVWLPWTGDVSAVKDLAVEHGAVFVLLNDGGVDVLSTDGGTRRFQHPVTGLTQGAQLFEYAGIDTPAAVFLTTPVGPAAHFGPGIEVPLGAGRPWMKNVVTQAVLFSFSNDGVRGYSPLGPFAIESQFTNTSPSRNLPEPRSIHLGRLPPLTGTPVYSFLFEYVAPDGGVTLSSWSPWMLGGDPEPTQPVQACPFGDAPQEVSFVVRGNRGGALVRCKEVGGARSFNVEVQLGRPSAEYFGSVESQFPYAGPTVPSEGNSIGRAIAGEEGRAWFVPLLPGTSVETGDMSRRVLRPLVLDRLPEAMVTLNENNRVRTYARAGEWIFNDEPALGLVSSTQQEGLVPLGGIPERAGWLVTTTGVVTAPSSGNSARVIAQLPMGQVFTPPVSTVLASPYINGVLHDVLLVTSGDALYAADVTAASMTSFSQPAELSVVLVPSPGVSLRGVTSDAVTSAGGLVGYVGNSTQLWRFSTDDLERWGLRALPLPPTSALPVELWSERVDQKARVGFSDGTVWSLPVMVALSAPAPSADGGVGRVNDYARRCGDVFATTRDGLYRLAGDAGLASWQRLDAVSAQLQRHEGARLYEAEYGLFLASTTGQVLALSAGDGGCP